MAEDPDLSPRKPTLSNSLTVAALGVVFGDIGTSPLYAVREAFHGPHAIALTQQNVLGVLSLILWSMILVISIKYLLFVLRANNKGEGGVLALTALGFSPRLIEKKHWTRYLIYFGLFGAALLVGDGMITPAISVLSAIEGLQVATPFFEPYVIPITLTILVGLFLAQHHGTARIGSVFGVVVFVWFVVIGTLGVRGIIANPLILQAIHPVQAMHFFVENGIDGILVLGAVFLVVTGGEALYADMGHFGKEPIQRAWFFVALPGLALNYFGQGALLLSSPEHTINPFYKLAPSWGLYPLVLISTAATIIASQAVISGVFSLARQAIQLGFCPRLQIIHTSKEEIGQIYIPPVNWGLLVMTCWLVLEFKSSSALAAAYGIAVSTTMVITTILVCSVALRVWHWKMWQVGAIFVFFFVIDFVFLWANFTKIADGGWFPLTVAAVVFILMTTWRTGRRILRQRLQEKSLPFEQFVESIKQSPPKQVEGVAVFMTGNPDGTPPALLHNVEHNKILHEKNILMTVISEDFPSVPRHERVELEKVGDGFYKIIAHYGFMQTPDIRDILRSCAEKDLQLNLDEITFFLGRETLLTTERRGMSIWREKLFAFMSRNAERATAYYNIPPHQVVEMGLQIEL